MTIAEALQKAVEGGYHIHGSDGMDSDHEGAHRACAAWTRNDNDSPCVAGMQESLLDPLFGRA
jgi:hypothetical protein